MNDKSDAYTNPIIPDLADDDPLKAIPELAINVENTVLAGYLVLLEGVILTGVQGTLQGQGPGDQNLRKSIIGMAQHYISWAETSLVIDPVDVSAGNLLRQRLILCKEAGLTLRLEIHVLGQASSNTRMKYELFDSHGTLDKQNLVSPTHLIRSEGVAGRALYDCTLETGKDSFESRWFINEVEIKAGPPIRPGLWAMRVWPKT